MKKNRKKRQIISLIVVEALLFIIAVIVMMFWIKASKDKKDGLADADASVEVKTDEWVEIDDVEDAQKLTPTPTEILTPTPTPTPEPTPVIPYNAYEEVTISWNPEWEYADYSAIHTSDVILYRSLHEGRPVITINAGHGTQGGSSVKTLCHPDGTPKVTGGSTAEGAIKATAVSSGTTMLDGTAEAKVNLKLALIVRDKLLDAGFSVLMIREEDDVQLDNIARTVFANNNSDCHIALHYDSTENDKGFYYMSVPDVSSYRNMEPVASHWQEHHALGDSLLEGMRSVDYKIYSDGKLPVDLTQTSYSTVASVDVEVGDRGSSYSDDVHNKIADGIVAGMKLYFGVDYSE